MSIFRRAAPESRALSFQSVWGTGADTLYGSSVASALQLAPLYSATRLLADQLASLPLQAYRQVGDTRQRIPDPPLLVDPSATAGGMFAWKFRFASSLLLQGNAYGLTTSVDRAGWPTSVEWLDPALVDVDESSGRPVYRYGGQVLESSSVTHVPLYSLPGTCVGVSPITAFRLVIEQGLQAQSFSVDWFKNGGQPSGDLERTDMDEIPVEVASAAKASFKAATRNRDLWAHGKGWKYTPSTVTADDAAFVMTAQLTANQIASIYGVDPTMVGGTQGTGSLTYTNVEQYAINFITFPLRPLAVRLEQMVSGMMSRPTFARVNLDAMARADLKTRYEAHHLALTDGWKSINEVRPVEDLQPITDEVGDEYGPAASQPTPVRVIPDDTPDPQRDIHVHVDARQDPAQVVIEEGAVQVTNRHEIDASTHIADGAVPVNVEVDARTSVEPQHVEVHAPAPAATRRTVETDDRGRITAINETPA